MPKKVATTEVTVSSRLSAQAGRKKDSPWYSLECSITKSLKDVPDDEVQAVIDKAFEEANANVDKQFEEACKAEAANS